MAEMMSTTRGGAPRRRLPRAAPAVVLALALALLGGGVFADPQDGKGRGKGKGDDRRRLSADEAASMVQKQVGGRVLSAQPLNSGSGGVRVKVLTKDGHVRIIVVQPNR